jgi:hypothetical protein
MNKELLKEFQLRAGGSHYPTINPAMQTAYAEQIVKYCIDLVENTELKDMVLTTYQQDFARGVKERIVKQIREQFDVR